MISDIFQNRFVVTDEVNNKGSMSYNNMKKFTSWTPVTLPEDIVSYLYQAAIDNSMGRRLVIYQMDKMSEKPPPNVSNIDNAVVIKFISMAVAVYNSDLSVPPCHRATVAPTSLAFGMCTSFHRNANKVRAG